MTGLFLAFEGIDGTGKSTQCQMLADRLRSEGHEVLLCSDPGSTPLGKQLRELLLQQREHVVSMRAEALLFMASRAEMVEALIRPAIDEGIHVISDRFLLSNIVYQGHAGRLNPSELWQVGRFCTGHLLPDLTFLFDLPVHTSFQRRLRDADRVEERGFEYFENVRAGFLQEASAHPNHVIVIDANAEISIIHEQVWLMTSNLLLQRH